MLSRKDDELASAARDVAKALGGDHKRTEFDLVGRLKKHRTLTEDQKNGVTYTKRQRNNT